MRVWRLARRPYQDLDGAGARQAGGRWNGEGVAVVYTSLTLSLAALEYLVHIDIEDVPDDLLAMEIEVPDEAHIEEVDVSDLPADWTRETDPPVCIEIGDRWVAEGRALVLRVPSAIVPEETNCLLNPAHPDADRVQVVRTREFAFDPRLL